jgi:hypothetical protein
MSFDAEGHVSIVPRQLDEALRGGTPLDDLVYRSFLRGTPRAFPTHAQYCAFVSRLSDSLRVHPQNICVRGSGWFGFSLSPNPDKLWSLPGPDSDVDVAFVDSHYYEQVEHELRRWESERTSYSKTIYAIRNTRRFLYYRYFDLPEIDVTRRHNQAFLQLPMEDLCGVPYPVNAFIYKDWWSVVERIKFDLRDVATGLLSGELPRGGDAPHQRIPLQDPQPRKPRKRGRR